MTIFKTLQNARRMFGTLYRERNDYKYWSKKILLEDKILHSKEMGVTHKRYCEHEIIVSLTTYSKRLLEVCYTIESIMQQTMLPNKIVLNLDPSAMDSPLPLALQRQMERGVVVVVVVEDTRSYKKLVPTMKANPDSIIITIDDDAIYEFDLVERLFNSYIKHPDCISACRTHRLELDADGNIAPYAKWGYEKSDTSNPNRLFLTGVGGVLYPPHSLDDEVFNEEVFTKICPTADDVWFYSMALKKGTHIVKCVTHSENGEDYISNDNVQDIGLRNINTGVGGRNDEQIRAVFERYDLLDKVR